MCTRHLKLLATPLFVQQLIFHHNNQNIASPELLALYEGNPPVTGGFPSQRASNTESISKSWTPHTVSHSPTSSPSISTVPSWQPAQRINTDLSTPRFVIHVIPDWFAFWNEGFLFCWPHFSHLFPIIHYASRISIMIILTCWSGLVPTCCQKVHKIFLTIKLQSIVNPSPPGQNGHHFTDNVFKCIFIYEKFCISIQILQVCS